MKCPICSFEMHDDFRCYNANCTFKGGKDEYEKEMNLIYQHLEPDLD